jgi:hypothetical protein
MTNGRKILGMDGHGLAALGMIACAVVLSMFGS